MRTLLILLVELSKNKPGSANRNSINRASNPSLSVVLLGGNHEGAASHALSFTVAPMSLTVTAYRPSTASVGLSEFCCILVLSPCPFSTSSSSYPRAFALLVSSTLDAPSRIFTYLLHSTPLNPLAYCFLVRPTLSCLLKTTQSPHSILLWLLLLLRAHNTC